LWDDSGARPENENHGKLERRGARRMEREEVELTNHHFCQNGPLHDIDLAFSVEISEYESRFGPKGDVGESRGREDARGGGGLRRGGKEGR